MVMYPLFLLILRLTGLASDSHFLRHYYTGVSGTGWGLPEYFEVGYVDDQQFVSYNSETRTSRPMAPWMNKLEADYYVERTEVGKGNEAVFQHNVRTAMSRFNHTGGFHSVQVLRGCELRDDGSTAVYEQLAYDGKDFIFLDTQRWVYVPTMHEAQISAQRWNSPELRMVERKRAYLEKNCIKWLKEYVNYAREYLEKKVPPEVMVTGKSSVGGTTLHCWVYGFHPRAVDVKWMKNERDEVPLDEARPILPNPDGTYQTRVTVEVVAGEEDSYSCHVDHSSLERTLTVKWEPKHGHSFAVVGGAVGFSVVVLAFIIFYSTLNRSSVSSYNPGTI